MAMKTAAAMQPVKDSGKKSKVTVVTPKEVTTSRKVRTAGGYTNRKISAQFYVELIREAQRAGKGYGDADYGPIVKIPVNKILQHPVNMKYFNKGDNFDELVQDIRNRGVQVAVGLLKGPNGMYYCVDGNRRVSALKVIGETYIKARIAQREMKGREIDYHVVMANISPRTFTVMEKADIIMQIYPNTKVRIQEKIHNAQNGGNRREVAGATTKKDVQKVFPNITGSEAVSILKRIENNALRERRGKDYVQINGEVNSATLMMFQNHVVKGIDKFISGQNEKTVTAAQKYLSKKSKNLFNRA